MRYILVKIAMSEDKPFTHIGLEAQVETGETVDQVVKELASRCEAFLANGPKNGHDAPVPTTQKPEPTMTSPPTPQPPQPPIVPKPKPKGLTARQGYATQAQLDQIAELGAGKDDIIAAFCLKKDKSDASWLKPKEAGELVIELGKVR